MSEKKFLVVVCCVCVVCCLLPVGACWVPGACWCLLVVPVGGACWWLRGACWVLVGLLRGRRGFTRQPENSKRALLSAPGASNTTKFHEKTPREGRKEQIFRRKREKKARNFLPPTPRAHHTRAPTKNKIGQMQSGQMRSRPPPLRSKNRDHVCEGVTQRAFLCGSKGGCQRFGFWGSRFKVWGPAHGVRCSGLGVRGQPFWLSYCSPRRCSLMPRRG